jgi:hypothetical protein
MASIPISGPEYLGMQDFKSVSERYGGLVKSCRFIVRIIPVGVHLRDVRSPVIEDLPYLCEVAEMPGRGFMNVDLRYYGPNFKLPFQTSYEDINLTFLCRTESLEREFFDNWMAVINPINSWDFNYRDDYYANIDIFHFGEFGEYEDDNAPRATYKFTLHNAYPVLVNPQPATWSDDQFQRLIVSFTYTHWSRKGLDKEPKITDPQDIDLVNGKINERKF